MNRTSLDDLLEIEVVSNKTGEYSVKFSDEYFVKHFGKFTEGEAKQLKSFIDAVICKQYHENKLAQNDSETSRTRSLNLFLAQNTNVSASLSGNSVSKIDRLQVVEKGENLIKVEKTEKFTRIIFDKANLKEHASGLLWLTYGWFMIFLLTSLFLFREAVNLYTLLTALCIALASFLVFCIGLVIVKKSQKHFLYISDSGVKHRRHIIGFEKSLSKNKFEQLNDIVLIYPHLNEKFFSLQLVDSQSETNCFGKFTQEEAEIVREFLKMLISEARDYSVTNQI